MTDTIVRVQDLSKRYRIGHKEQKFDSLSEAITSWAWSPINNFKRLRSLTRFSDDDQEDVIWALSNISFEVGRGEVLGIIGRNGAGKSTLLKVLSRITPPTSGRVRLQGRMASLLEVGTGFHSELTGRQNVYLNGTILGMKPAEIDANFDEILAFSEVGHFIDTPVKRYSSGMRVRLGFAVAAHLQPEILIIDEVLAVGDIAFQEKCIGKINDISRGGRTVLFVSHNMASILNLCKRTILLEDGKIAADGVTTEVVQRYLASAQMAGGDRVWSDPETAPQNTLVRLQRVSVFQPGRDTPTSQAYITQAIDIRINYWNLRPGAKLFSCIVLKDHQGAVVLRSANFESMTLEPDVWHGRAQPVGQFQSVCRIPGNFLNNGRYGVSVLIGLQSTSDYLYEDSVVSFQVVDTGKTTLGLSTHWPGVVRPKLTWSTEQLSSDRADENSL